MNRFPKTGTKAFINFAIEAINEANENENVVLDMRTWGAYNPDSGKFHACVAGAAFIKAYGLPSKVMTEPIDCAVNYELRYDPLADYQEELSYVIMRVEQLLLYTGHLFSLDVITDIAKSMIAFDKMRDAADINIVLNDIEAEESIINEVNHLLKTHKIKEHGNFIQKLWYQLV